VTEGKGKLLSVLSVGGMNLDVLADAEDAFREGDSLRGRVHFRAGGVARNVASHLAKTGIQVELLTALGSDENALRLVESCRRDGIGLAFSQRTDAPAPVYVAVHDRQGEMRCAVNDMRAVESLTPGFLRGCPAFRQPFGAVFLDANLSPECLSAAAEAADAPLVADPVSAVKCERLRAILPRLAALKPNRMEAEALSGETEPARQAKGLLAAGVKAVFISLGAQGVYYADGKSEGLLPAAPLPHAGLTGAGDAMAAGITLGVAKGLPARETAALGLQFAARHLRKQPDDLPEEERP